MRTNAMPLSAGIAVKNPLKASSPPAEAPIPATGGPGCSGFSSGISPSGAGAASTGRLVGVATVPVFSSGWGFLFRFFLAAIAFAPGIALDSLPQSARIESPAESTIAKTPPAVQATVPTSHSGFTPPTDARPPYSNKCRSKLDQLETAPQPGAIRAHTAGQQGQDFCPASVH